MRVCPARHSPGGTVAPWELFPRTRSVGPRRRFRAIRPRSCRSSGRRRNRLRGWRRRIEHNRNAGKLLIGQTPITVGIEPAKQRCGIAKLHRDGLSVGIDRREDRLRRSGCRLGEGRSAGRRWRPRRCGPLWRGRLGPHENRQHDRESCKDEGLGIDLCFHRGDLHDRRRHVCRGSPGLKYDPSGKGAATSLKGKGGPAFESALNNTLATPCMS